MKRCNKKGFTIVELVIVIAVIAILAAVLIPTIAGLVRKANISADTVLAKELNSAIARVAAEEEVDKFEDALAALKAHGYLIANLNAKADECYFVWDDANNQIILVDGKNDYEVLYSNKTASASSNWMFAISNPTYAAKVEAAGYNVKKAVASVADLKETISNGGSQVIYMDESIEVDSSEQFTISSGDITIKLTGSVVSGDNNDSYAVENVPFLVDGGTLTIEGGTINATGSWLDADGDPVDSAVIAQSGTLNLNDVTVEASGKSIVLAYAGAGGTISNATINTKSSAINVGGGSNVVVENCTINVDNEAVWVSNSGGYNSSATIKGGTYSGIGNTIAMYGGNIIIEDGTFSATQTNLFKFYATGSSITIKNGTFITSSGTYTFDQLDETVLKGMMAASTVGTVTVTPNDDGSWTISN